ncbi:unnamed protein product [Camellia sinensis]
MQIVLDNVAQSSGSMHSMFRRKWHGGLAGKNWRLVKFCNGELMGKKMKMTLLHQGVIKKDNVGLHVSMSLTANVAGEAKLRDLEMEKRDPRTVVAVILGGGAGTRLFPLTKRCAKPAVPIGGAYRLIDVPMSNCINSGINKVYILTQFNSALLNRHLIRAYSLGGGVTFGDGFVEALAATQTQGETGKRWFQGTADAVRQFHWLFEDARSKDIEDVLILSGDHLYRMDYMDFVHNHHFGVDLVVDTTVIRLSREEDEKKPYIASMGVYVFKKEILLNLLRWRFPTANDFGSEIIPASAKEFFIKAYLFNDYWEDIGTIKSFFEANLALTAHPPRSSFYDANNPMYTSRRNLPPSKIDSSKIRCWTPADYYETDAKVAALVAEGRVPIGIGENTKIKNCIIDKNARIGKNVVIANSEGIQEADGSSEGFYIRSGITIILKKLNDQRWICDMIIITTSFPLFSGSIIVGNREISRYVHCIYQ